MKTKKFPTLNFRKRSTRLLFIGTAFSGGGAEYVSRQMHLSFPDDPFLLFCENDRSLLANKRARVLPALRGHSWVTKLFNNLWRLGGSQIAKLMVRPTATISHLEGPNFINIVTLAGGRRIIFVHNVASRNYAQQKVSNWIKRWLIRMLYPHADKIFAVSTEVKTDLINRFGIDRKTISVLPNPINPRQVYKQSVLPVNELSISLQLPYVVCVASLTTQKNHEFLLNVFKFYKKQYDVGHLFLVGEGALSSKLMKHCDEIGLTYGGPNVRMGNLPDVVFCGFVSNPYPIIRNSKCLVLTSRWEGQPIVILEALSLGVPFLTTNSTPFLLENFARIHWLPKTTY